ncbi:MAG: hypothetical protein N4A62_20525 [Marinisporobacter sp.]|jgi:hypothetical protein|nr:hypothetical protein [Marinisporobacter sp.]
MQVPKIDKRNKEDLYKQLMDMLPYYTPEWRFNLDHPDPGSALFIIFADMFKETIDRLNKVPFKNYLSFLNLLDIRLKPVVPSRSVVEFKPSLGITENIYIKKGTILFSEGIDEESDRVLFETRSSFYVSPSVLKGIYCVDPFQDKIVKMNQDNDFEDGMTLFDVSSGQHIQKHGFELLGGCEMNLMSPSIIRIKLYNKAVPHIVNTYVEKLSTVDYVQWKYYNRQGWQSFDRVDYKDDHIILYKDQKLNINFEEEDGAYKIGCFAKDISALKEISIDGVEISSATESEELVLDEMYYNDIPIDEDNRFCFGKQFSEYDCFYIKSDEIFSKKGAQVTIAMNLEYVEKDLSFALPEIETKTKFKFIMDKTKLKKPEKKKIIIDRVVMEYWNGKGWLKLKTNDLIDGLFYGKDENQQISFYCPLDIEKVIVNSEEGYWLRFRIVTVENKLSIDGIYLCPWLNKINTYFDYRENFQPTKWIKTFNNGNESKKIETLFGVEKPIKVFETLRDKHTSTYFCFDQPLMGMPVNMYFQMMNLIEKELNCSWYILTNYQGKKDWLPVRVGDKTVGFSKSGNVSLEIGKKMIKHQYFDIEGYWLKVEMHDLDKKILPKIKNIYMNTVEILQCETHSDETFLVMNDPLSNKITLNHTPVIDEKVWVNEYGFINDDEMNDILKKNDDHVDIKLDDGVITEIWIKWSRVHNLKESNKNDRHYEIDSYKGIIKFGDGKKGKSVPEQPLDNVRVDYASGGGEIGNLPKGMINNLLNSIAYVDSVVNINPASGGSDSQDLKDAVNLGTSIIRHGGRAVTPRDFEKLTKINFQEVIKVKCLSNMNQRGIKEYGHITLVVMSKDYMNKLYSIDLCAKIRAFLYERSNCIATANSSIHVVAPYMIYINLDCEIILESLEEFNRVEFLVHEAIAKFLDPINGRDKKGWKIGELPKPAHFYSVLKNIKGVKYIQNISLDGNYILNGKNVYVSLDQMKNLPFAVPTNGKHNISIRTER